MSDTDLAVVFVKVSKDAKLPTRGSTFSAGMDLYSVENTVIPKRGRKLVKIGIIPYIPSHHYGRVASRSGISLKYGIEVGAGVIDSDYRGELGVVLYNHSDVDFTVSVGDRIAQLIIEKIAVPSIAWIYKRTDTTDRGEGGFGSTGK
jgi:deoxyuridine 5'-triphosphate nucleotidohydrolase